MPASQGLSPSKAKYFPYKDNDASTLVLSPSQFDNDADASAPSANMWRHDVHDKSSRDLKPIKDDASIVSAVTARQKVDTRDTVKKDKDSKDDDTKTLVAGKRRRDRNGKVMKKKELAAEGVIRVLVACTVM